MGMKLMELVLAWMRDVRLAMDGEPVTDRAEMLLMQATQTDTPLR